MLSKKTQYCPKKKQYYPIKPKKTQWVGFFKKTQDFANPANIFQIFKIHHKNDIVKCIDDRKCAPDPVIGLKKQSSKISFPPNVN